MVIDEEKMRELIETEREGRGCYRVNQLLNYEWKRRGMKIHGSGVT
jgi:hypothetical protein